MGTSTERLLNNEIKKQLKEKYEELSISGLKFCGTIESVNSQVSLESLYQYDGPGNYAISGQVELTIKNKDGVCLSERHSLIGANSVYLCWNREELEVIIDSLTFGPKL